MNSRIFFLILFLLLTGCSNRNLYEGHSLYHAEQCRKDHDQSCEEPKSYDEYKNEREKLIKNDN
ncbi:MAG: hypothetical protein ACQ9MH_10990 [Nitrospinales bacterium]